MDMTMNEVFSSISFSTNFHFKGETISLWIIVEVCQMLSLEERNEKAMKKIEEMKSVISEEKEKFETEFEKCTKEIEELETKIKALNENYENEMKTKNEKIDSLQEEISDLKQAADQTESLKLEHDA